MTNNMIADPDFGSEEWEERWIQGHKADCAWCERKYGEATNARA